MFVQVLELLKTDVCLHYLSKKKLCLSSYSYYVWACADIVHEGCKSSYSFEESHYGRVGLQGYVSGQKQNKMRFKFSLPFSKTV